MTVPKPPPSAHFSSYQLPVCRVGVWEVESRNAKACKESTEVEMHYSTLFEECTCIHGLTPAVLHVVLLHNIHTYVQYIIVSLYICTNITSIGCIYVYSCMDARTMCIYVCGVYKYWFPLTLPFRKAGNGSSLRYLAIRYSPKRCRSKPCPLMARNLFLSCTLRARGKGTISQLVALLQHTTHIHTINDAATDIKKPNTHRGKDTRISQIVAAYN